MMYRPRYLKKKSHYKLNEFSIKGGRIAINGKILDGVTSYSIDWKSGELTGLTINMVGKMK